MAPELLLTPLLMKIGLKLRLIRHKAQLDQCQLATKLSLSVAEYSEIENGLCELKTPVLEQLFEVFGLTEEQFFYWQPLEKDYRL